MAAFGDTAVFESFQVQQVTLHHTPLSNTNKPHWFTKLDLSGTLALVWGEWMLIPVFQGVV